jgi:O-antigen biosynthesis protein
MLEWTGERFVPWAKEPAVAYEHLHRYLWASSFAKGRRVLDLASGEGYGADMLARQAAFVCGLDIDEDAVRHASEKYRRPNLQFLKGSITAVPIHESSSFDVITCFEAIEHIDQHDELLKEVRRLLKPDGLFVVSTPNKEAYNAPGEPANPFHVREITFDEFNALLTRHFSRVSYLGQRVHPASSMWPIGLADGASVREFTVERRDGEFQALVDDQRPALYYVAIASDAASVECQGSVLLDSSDELIREKDRELAMLRVDLKQRDEALEWREHQVKHLESQILELEKGLDWREAQVKELSDSIDSTQEQLESKRKELEAIFRTKYWKLVGKLRALRSKLTETAG